MPIQRSWGCSIRGESSNHLWCVALIGVAFLSGCIQEPGDSSANQFVTMPSAEEAKRSATAISYDNLARNTENYIGKTVYYRGKILQVNEIYSGNYVLRVATKQEPYVGYYKDVVWVNYKGSRLLEDDIVDIWGNVRGLRTYTAVLGNEITIPEIDALYIKLVAKAGESEALTGITPPQTSAIPETSQTSIAPSPSSPSLTPSPLPTPSPLHVTVANWNAVDDQGYPTMNLELSQPLPQSLTLTLTNPDGNEVGRSNVNAGQISTRLRMTSGYTTEKTPSPGNYILRFLYCVEEGIISCKTEIDAARPVTIGVKGAQGAEVYVSKVTPTLSCFLNECSLSKLSVEITNNGDVPAYISEPELRIGGIGVPTFGSGVVSPGKSSTISISAFKSGLTYGVSHSYNLFLRDSAGTTLTQYSAAIVATG